MSKTKLYPCTDIPVTNLETGKPFPPEGASVELTPYYEERMKEGTLAPGNPLDGMGGEGNDGDDLQGMKVPELKKMATDLGIDGADGMKKAELIDAIEALEQS